MDIKFDDKMFEGLDQQFELENWSNIQIVIAGESSLKHNYREFLELEQSSPLVRVFAAFQRTSAN